MIRCTHFFFGKHQNASFLSMRKWMLNNNELLEAIDQSGRFIANHIHFNGHIQRRFERIPHRWMKILFMESYCIGRFEHWPTIISAWKCIVCGWQFPVIHQMFINPFPAFE